MSRSVGDSHLGSLGVKLMRALRTSLILIVVLLVVVFTNTAFAKSVTMTYEGHQGATAIDGSPYIGYPYYFSINGSSNYTPLICDSYDNNVSIGQTFQATVTPYAQVIAGMGGMFGNSAAILMDYRAAGLIFKSMLAGTLDRAQAQWAIWACSRPTRRATHSSPRSAEQASTPLTWRWRR